MIFLILLIVAVIVLLASRKFCLSPAGTRDDWDLGWGILLVAAFALLFAVIAIAATTMYQNNRDHAEIQYSYRTEAINKQRANDILDKMKKQLTVKYPAYEKSIFKMLSNPKGVSVFAVQYPEIRASALFQNYADKIEKYRNKIHDARQERNDIRLRIQVRKGNSLIYIPFLLN